MVAEIPVPIFDAVVLFACDMEEKALADVVEKRFGAKILEDIPEGSGGATLSIDQMILEDIPEGSGGATLSIDQMIWVVYIPHLEEMDWETAIRTFSHEAVHVALLLARQTGVEDDETTAYTQDWLLGQFMEEAKKEALRRNAARKKAVRKKPRSRKK